MARQFTALVCRRDRRSICQASVAAGISVGKIQHSSCPLPEVLVASSAELRKAEESSGRADQIVAMLP